MNRPRGRAAASTPSPAGRTSRANEAGEIDEASTSADAPVTPSQLPMSALPANFADIDPAFLEAIGKEERAKLKAQYRRAGRSVRTPRRTDGVGGGATTASAFTSPGDVGIASFFNDVGARVKLAADEVGTRVGFGRLLGRGEDASPSTPNPTNAAASTVTALTPTTSRGDVDESRLGTIRSRTEHFARLRATAAFIRETEARVRAEDARREAEEGLTVMQSPDANGVVTYTSTPASRGRRRRATDATTKNAPPPPPRATEQPSETFVSICDAAEKLASSRRAIETSLMPQYYAFVNSLRESAAAAAENEDDEQLQTNVETHLATLLLVETELQSEMKRLKTNHLKAVVLRAKPDCAHEASLKKNVAYAYQIARTDLSAQFKRARDSVSEMLKGNAAAKVVSTQRVLRASDAAYDELERFYKTTVRLRGEFLGHPGMREGGEAGAGVRVAAAAREAALATRAALRHCFHETTIIKHGGAGARAGAGLGANEVPEGVEESWRAHIASLDEELSSARVGARSGASSPATSVASTPRRGNSPGTDGDAPSVVVVSTAPPPADMASAALEQLRGALRNAIDAVEEATRACASLAAAASTDALGNVVDEVTLHAAPLGYRRTTTHLVPVKDKTAALFHALTVIVDGERRGGGGGGNGGGGGGGARGRNARTPPSTRRTSPSRVARGGGAAAGAGAAGDAAAGANKLARMFGRLFGRGKDEDAGVARGRSAGYDAIASRRAERRGGRN